MNVTLVSARSRKGADRGVDSLPYFYEFKDERCIIIVQVKGGGVKNEKAAGGILLTVHHCFNYAFTGK